MMSLIVRSSAIHAAGVFTLQHIPCGTRIVEYTGERVKQELADGLYENRPHTYLFGVGDGSRVVDGYGIAMFVNHSCEPNCETEEDGDERIWVVAMRDIRPGEELAYDYLLYDGDDEAACSCGAPRCRGTMYSKPEVTRQKRRRRK